MRWDLKPVCIPFVLGGRKSCLSDCNNVFVSDFSFLSTWAIPTNQYFLRFRIILILWWILLDLSLLLPLLSHISLDEIDGTPPLFIQLMAIQLLIDRIIVFNQDHSSLFPIFIPISRDICLLLWVWYIEWVFCYSMWDKEWYWNIKEKEFNFSSRWTCMSTWWSDLFFAYFRPSRI